jgi:hypothetical protein
VRTRKHTTEVTYSLARSDSWLQPSFMWHVRLPRRRPYPCRGR